MKKKKKRVKVAKVIPNIDVSTEKVPIHEVVLHVESPEPPPLDVEEEFGELTETPKKKGFWGWLTR
jgi:hypothetical protein